MIGFYDYTVILTYLSLMSGTIGIMLCLNGMGHPYLGMFFLLFSGLCDTFDGKVARTKKDRTPQMKKFGIQIDFRHALELRCFDILCIFRIYQALQSIFLHIITYRHRLY